MAEYVYRANDGEERSVFMSMSANQPEWIKREGKRFNRVYGNCQVNSDPVSCRYPLASSSLPRNMPGWENRGGFDPVGKPIVRNKRDHDYACKTLDLQKE